MTEKQENFIKSLINKKDTSDLMNEVSAFKNGMITSSGAASKLISMLLECPEKEQINYSAMPKIIKGKVTVKIGDRVETTCGTGVITSISKKKTASVKLDSGNYYSVMAWDLTAIN